MRGLDRFRASARAALVRAEIIFLSLGACLMPINAPHAR